MTEGIRGEYRLVFGAQAMDLDAVHAYLTRSYWAQGISKELVARALRGSMCFGVFHGDVQVAFARVISDCATFAYLADVYVLEEHRRRGLSVRLLEEVVEHPALQGLRRFVLATRDAHELYARFGFTPLAHPEYFMEVNRPGIYLQAPSAT